MAISAQTAFGQIWLDGTDYGPEYTNQDDVINATVDGGWFVNGGPIIEATVNDGALANEDAITNATINDGSFNNYGTITEAVLDGGRLYNMGQIDTMEYISGTYDASATRNAVGTIGTLTVAGTLDASGNWGDIGKLQFDGGSILFTANPDGSFSSLNVQTVDWFGGSLQFDFTALGFFGEELGTYFFETFGGGNGISIASLFGDIDFDDIDLVSFTLTSGGNTLANNEWIFEGSELVFRGPPTPPITPPGGDPNATPEPATLLILGLGIMGAGLATRRRRK